MECRIVKCGKCKITNKYSNTHKGVDIVALKNNVATTDTIVAHSDGKVIAIMTGKKNNKGAKGMESYGNYVQIMHYNGYTTFYAHLSSVIVRVGQTVKKGQSIGYMGNTGNSYGAHLHFEVRKNKSYASAINPTKYLNSDLYNIPTVFYRIYSNNKKRWFDTTSNGKTAGNQKDIIGGIQIKTNYAGKLKYKAHIKGGKWLKEVTKWDNTSEGYAGIKGKAIDAITISSEKGKLSYRVCLKDKTWLPWVTKYGTKKDDEYAGIYGKEIVAIQIKIN